MTWAVLCARSLRFATSRLLEALQKSECLDCSTSDMSHLPASSSILLFNSISLQGCFESACDDCGLTKGANLGLVEEGVVGFWLVQLLEPLLLLQLQLPAFVQDAVQQTWKPIIDKLMQISIDDAA